MINGINRNNNDSSYFEVALDSSSSLKDFSFNRKNYEKKYILNESIEEEDSQASKMGKLVETILLEPEKFDDKFHLSACASVPTGLMLKFCESLYSIFIENTDKEGNVNKEFSEMLREAYTKAGYKIPFERVIKDFEGGDAEIYFNEILRVRTKGLVVVTPSDVANAEKIVEGLKVNPISADIVNLVDSKRYTVKIQYQVENYEVDGHKFKSMIDFLIIDHLKQTISPYDLKVTWSVENFLTEYFLYRRSYFQAFLYKKACIQLKEDLELDDYTVENLKFMVCDSINYYSPLIYTLSDKDMEDAYNGFTYNNRYYPGVKETIEGLKWALSENIWNISMKNYKLKGIVPLIEK